MSSPFAARVLGLTLLAVLWSAPTATAAGSWSLTPSGGRPVLYAEGAPGTVLQDTVSVTNRGDKAITVRLHADGVTFADATVRVPARTRADVPFTVSVPSDDRSTEIVARDTDGGTRQTRLQLRASIPELSALTVEHVTVGADRITYDVVNRGTTTLVPRLTVYADGVLGPVLDRAARTLPVELRPGRRLHLTEPWPDHPALDAVDVRLTVTAAGGARDTAGVSAWFVPWGAVAGGAGAVVVAGVGAGWVVAVVRRRRRRMTDGDWSAEHPRTEVELTGAVT